MSEPHHDALPSFGGDDPVSPELALVDSALRERLLHAEADHIQAGPVPYFVPSAPARPPLESSATIRPERSPRRRRALIAIFGGLLVVVVGAAATWHARPGAAPPPTVVAPAAPTNSVTTQTRKAAATRPAARTFAWAPASGAVAYHVEIRRGDVVVYTARTRATRISLRLRKAGHRTAPLRPGTYRWYVWPLLRHGHARRRGAAIVATTIVVRR